MTKEENKILSWSIHVDNKCIYCGYHLNTLINYIKTSKLINYSINIGEIEILDDYSDFHLNGSMLSVN